MRILRLRVDGRRDLDLHPRLSVVTGLDAGQAATVRRAVAAVAGGLAPRDGGLLEAAGMLLDATQDDLDLLDLGAEPTSGVLVAAAVADDVPEGAETLAALAAAERDALLLATDRRWAAMARDRARRADRAGAGDLARAETLRLEIAAHGDTDVEPLRRALDAHRDARRSAGPAGDRTATSSDDGRSLDRLVHELGALGVDLRDRDVPGDEVQRIAEDVVDEHRRHGAWVVGARVELDGSERRLLGRVRAGGSPGAATAALLPESGERRAARAAAAQADAIARADERREQVVALGAPPAPDLADRLAVRIAERRGDPPAGSVPLVLDRVLAGLDEAGVADLLARLEPLARGVQLLVLDEHPAAVAWARGAGVARAAVVSPGPAPAAGATPTMRPTPTHEEDPDA